MPPARHRTIGDLFGPGRRRPPHQLGLGPLVNPAPSRCLGCGGGLDDERSCRACGAFTCASCDRFTTTNGGDGRTCYRCSR